MKRVEPMTPEPPEHTGLDEAAVAVGLGLVLVGVVVMGLLATLLGTTTVGVRLPGIGVVPVHAAFSPDLRATLVAVGFSVLFVWGTSRFVRALVG